MVSKCKIGSEKIKIYKNSYILTKLYTYNTNIITNKTKLMASKWTTSTIRLLDIDQICWNTSYLIGLIWEPLNMTFAVILFYSSKSLSLYRCSNTDQMLNLLINWASLTDCSPLNEDSLTIWIGEGLAGIRLYQLHSLVVKRGLQI